MIVHAAHDWQQHFLQKAQAFYDTYLAWLYVRPAPDAVSGRRVLEALLARGTGERREKKFKRDASVAADDSDEEPLQPLRILREFWSPDVYGLQRFCQRLFQVEFNDGSKQTLVAEDLFDGWDEPFEENELEDPLRGKGVCRGWDP